VLGFGLVQLPFSTLDWAARPGDEQLHNEIVAWGVARLEEISGQRPDGLGFLLDSRSDRDPVAERNDFELDDWYIRNLAMEFVSSPLVPSTPSGFHIRPLNGEVEVAAYVDLHRAAFQSRNMTVDWRTCLGRAILSESLQRFYEMGAKRILIDAESNNPASQHLYEVAGFREINRTYKYFRHF
jgi:hypothetical protein